MFPIYFMTTPLQFPSDVKMSPRPPVNRLFQISRTRADHLLTVMLLLFASSVSCRFFLPHEEKSFVTFMRKKNLLYTGAEYHFRLGIYLTQSRYVQSFNSGSRGFRLALNKLACLTPSEYRTLLGSPGSAPARSTSRGPSVRRAADPPDSWDWRTKNVVQAVKDQGQCGSCWAFSAIAAQETQWAITNTDLFSLSEQNLVDCVSTSFGCEGGDKEGAYRYVISWQSGHFNSEDVYKYTATDGVCQFVDSAPLTTVKDVFKSKPNDESDLLNTVYSKGATAVSIDASHSSFQLYSGGVYNEPDCSSSTHDHAVLAVGYGVDGTTPYWIIKNSWGVDWGEQGYIRMSRNKNNQCCIACAGVVPIDV
jgi:cathepsin L